jgi:LPXTG-motif cell wall-anchored protein
MSNHMFAILAIAVLLGIALVLLSKKKKLPVPPIPLRRAMTAELLAKEEAEVRELARRVVERYPELGSSPENLLAEIAAYRNKAHPWADSTSRIILEKLLTARSLQQAQSYWQVNEFLAHHDKRRKPRSG